MLNKCELYANDSKIISIIRDLVDSQLLQKDINSVTDWTKKWMMSLNIAKCKLIHFARDFGNLDFDIEDTVKCERVIMEKSEVERDLGVLVSKDLAWKRHVNEMVSKANKILGMLTKTFSSRDLNLWKQLYVSLVRPHLEFASSVWN